MVVVPLVRLSPAAGLTLITRISADQWRAQYPGLMSHVTADRERSAGCGSSTTDTAPRRAIVPALTPTGVGRSSRPL